MKIIGAGMAGLLAANMLRHRDPVVIEKQPTLPNNHSAVLRFRSPIVGDVLNVPFKKVIMIKDHIPWRNSVADALAYSFKNGSTYRSDRSIIAGTTVAERWIAPLDLIGRMAERSTINFSQEFIVDGSSNTPTISTMPMQLLMELLDYPGRHAISFNFVPGVNVTARIERCDAYISLLVPDPAMQFSRISITGDELIVEVPAIDSLRSDIAERIVSAAAELIGIDKTKIKEVLIRQQRYAKITPIDDAARKNFMHWATDKFNIYSLGRFATWRPGLLLDDLVQDIRKIDRWLSAGKYAVARER
jgi:hypothetical protein